MFRSTRHIYAQVIDDLQKQDAGRRPRTWRWRPKATTKADKKARAKKVGAAIAKKCLEKGIDKVVFDRAGYKYHGRVSALADGAREAGLKF